MLDTAYEHGAVPGQYDGAMLRAARMAELLRVPESVFGEAGGRGRH